MQEIIELWNSLKNVPKDELDQIDEDFHIWKKGTSFLHIWYWFEERDPNNILEF